MRKEKQYVCLECNGEFKSSEKNPKFCSHSCSAKHSNKNKGPLTVEHKAKISNSLKDYYKKNPDKVLKGEIQALNVAKYTRGKYREYPPETVLDLSKRTVSKILKRLKIGCSNCEWDLASGDIHHINGKGFEGCDKHNNLTYLCPNCHRLAHANKIDKENLVNLETFIGDTWKRFYYG